MRASNHAVARYLERELDLQPERISIRIQAARAVLQASDRERRVNVQAARREIERIFERPRMTKVAGWANGANFRVIVDGRVYCCRGDTVTTFYRETMKGRRSVGQRQRRRERPSRSGSRNGCDD